MTTFAILLSPQLPTNASYSLDQRLRQPAPLRVVTLLLHCHLLHAAPRLVHVRLLPRAVAVTVTMRMAVTVTVTMAMLMAMLEVMVMVMIMVVVVVVVVVAMLVPMVVTTAVAAATPLQSFLAHGVGLEDGGACTPRRLLLLQLLRVLHASVCTGSSLHGCRWYGGRWPCLLMPHRMLSLCTIKKLPQTSMPIFRIQGARVRAQALTRAPLPTQQAAGPTLPPS